MNRKTIFFIIILLTVSVRGFSQRFPDVNRYRDLMQPSNTVQHFSTKIDPTNEFKLILTTAFSLYKHFVSSQDAVHCVFYPSCSVYALETIQTNGFIGIFDAIDRLTRCNGFSPEKYHMHEASHHFYDPVKKLH